MYLEAMSGGGFSLDISTFKNFLDSLLAKEMILLEGIQKLNPNSNYVKDTCINLSMNYLLKFVLLVIRASNYN